MENLQNFSLLITTPSCGSERPNVVQYLNNDSPISAFISEFTRPQVGALTNSSPVRSFKKILNYITTRMLTHEYSIVWTTPDLNLTNVQEFSTSHHYQHLRYILKG